jgi:DNA adenine methylase
VLLSTIKSPLRYPGGKSRAVKIIFEYIPFNTTELCSPFFGGGSFELYCVSKGIRVYGYDNFQPLVDFWQWLLKDPIKLSNAVEKVHPLKRSDFYQLQKIHTQSTDSFERAVLFFILNRTSFSGSTLSGGMASGGIDDNPRFTKSSIERLRNFRIQNLSVDLLDFTKSIAKHPTALLYLDPPYIIDSKLYGIKGNLHKNFDHEALASILRKREKWILSYNDSNIIKKNYRDYQFVYPKWSYGMSNDKNSREVIILSNDIAEINRIKSNE